MADGMAAATASAGLTRFVFTQPSADSRSDIVALTTDTSHSARSPSGIVPQHSPQGSCSVHNEMSSPTEAPPLRSEEQDVPGETLGSAERQRLSLDVTMSSVSDGSSGVHSETNFGGASAEEQSNDTDQLMADSASHKDLLLRSGAEQEEMLALHRAAAQSAEQRIAGGPEQITTPRCTDLEALNVLGVDPRSSTARRGGRPRDLLGHLRGSRACLCMRRR